MIQANAACVLQPPHARFLSARPSAAPLQVGMVSSLAMVLLIRKVTLTFLYMSSWANETLDADTRKDRTAEAHAMRAAATRISKPPSKGRNVSPGTAE
jgi:hypothetical protein